MQGSQQQGRQGDTPILCCHGNSTAVLLAPSLHRPSRPPRRVALAVRPLAHCPSPRRASTTTSAAVGDVHSHAADGPQPETLFRPDAAALGAAGAGGGEAEERKEEQLPGFQSMPHPDYQVERPQEQTPPGDSALGSCCSGALCLPLRPLLRFAAAHMLGALH